MPTTTRPTHCCLCEAHCGILVTTDENDQVTRITGDPDDILSKGYICPKATAMGGLHHDPDRLRTPLRRVGEKFEPVGWDEAFDEIGQRLRAIRKEHGLRALSMYLGNPAAHNTSVANGLALRLALLTPNFYTASSIDQYPHEFTAWRMLGSNVLVPVVDIDRTDRLVIVGANPAVSNGSLSTMPGAKRRIKAVRDRGGKVVVIDPRRTETAKLADQHVAVEPGGDVYLLMAVLHVLFAENLCDETVLARSTRGAADLRALVAEATPAAMAPLAGVTAETIMQLAREHAAARSAAMYCRIGICQQQTGTLVTWLISAINVVTGNLDRPGGMMFPTPPVDVPRFAKFIPVAYGRWTDRSGRYPAFRSELPIAALTDELTVPGPGRVRSMITYAGNPVSSVPHRGRLDAALADLDLMVSVDIYLTETTRHADFILPPISHLERGGFNLLVAAFSVRDNARYTHQILDKPAGGLDDWQILNRLILEVLPVPARRFLGRPLRRITDLFTPERMLALPIALGPYGVLRRGRRGLTIKRMRESVGGIDLGALKPRLRHVIATRSRTVELAPESFLAEAKRLLPDALAGRSHTRADEGFDLKLIGRRQMRSNNSWLHNVPTMVTGSNRCTVLMHPDDAQRCGVTDEETVTVTSTTGTIDVALEISDEIRSGTVAIPHGWGHRGTGWRVAGALAGQNVNLLHDPSRVDRISGNSAVNDTWVRVTPVATAEHTAPAESGAAHT
ncbi:molybdopterin-dependent oxidoreductase [Tsukamurella paurometabola]|uniref:Molybdopterin dinucleotide-binding region n=1 Tax=Tsukamurella paurometabola (strain ATCC 8368 / DSM 20162 / CCUG 35730 / CIP 100753 / JCM 10117 / KCTC 9821 / NBRC 16120 / NCIMB 702349 / NCTC 13040) TaxID=521096 RepID=D5UXV1_TSUPD|nr:molybdopterin-dependent oxidoreductase [Tsukamurella paurometabola]ADG80188.1 molybdopterin dinucleotide-binding region [Tsukamurella paurometabola DSM 20162]SUP38764.1 Formate dehydrogenase H [Tsukamurella paurometabola]